MTPIFHERRGRERAWLLWPIVAAAAIARIAVAGHEAFWLDEGYTWWDAHQPLASLWSIVSECDPHPPLFFALMHGWIGALGDGAVAMRALSIVFGCATVVMVFMAGRELDNMRGSASGRFAGAFDAQGPRTFIAPLAALCFAFTPFQIYFSVEARPYALLCFAAAMTTWGALRLVRIDRAHRGLSRFDDGPYRALAWILLVVGAVIALWTNNTAVLFVGALALFFVASWLVDPASRASLRGVLVAGAVVAVLWAPDLPLLWRQSREVAGDFWIPKPTLAGLHGELRFAIGLDTYDAVWWLVAAMACGIVLVGRRLSWRAATLLAALAIGPVVLNVAVSVVASPILIARALIAATPAFVLALVAAAALVRGRGLRMLLVGALLVAHGAAAVKFFMTTDMKEPWRPIVATLAVVAKDAPVFVVPNELALPLGFEAKAQGVALRVRGVPADFPATGLAVRYPSGKCTPSAAGLDPATLRDGLANESRVVLITRRNNLYDRAEEVPAALASLGFERAGDATHQPGDLRIVQFVRPVRGPS